MEKFLRLFCLFLFAFGISLSLSGNNGKIVVWFHDGNNKVLHINEMPEFQYIGDSILFYNGNTTYKWPLEIVQKLTFEDVEPIFWTVDASSLNDDMGTVTGNGLIEDGETVSLTAVSSEGYVFDCWSDGRTDNPYTFTPTGNVELTALFLPGKYSMTFVLDNGEENVVKTQNYASVLTAPENLVKTGFTFKGWSPAVPATVPASDMTFTAQWERNKYLVSFIVEDTVAKKDSVLYEGTITKPAVPVKEGYTFTSWQPEVPESMPANDLTFTAQFSINQYTMTFVLDNGEENVVKTQNYASALTAPEDLVKTGFTFKGWSPSVPATVPASDMTFNAQWERNKYKVTWIVDGQSTMNEVEYEAAIVMPEEPVKEGYMFTGWDNEIPEKMPANDLTFKALFKINTYAVVYMVKGNEWARDSLDYGATIVKRDYATAEGETFNGWLSNADYLTMPAHDVVYTADITSGIATIIAGKSDVDVYTLQGRLVARRLPVAQIRKIMPRGVYIIDGVKVVVR